MLELAEEQVLVVGGYSFDNEEMAALAKKELEGVRYTRSKLNMSNPEEVLMVYNRILRDCLFKTPVGFAYLKELYDYLIVNPRIDNKDVHPIIVSPLINAIRATDKEAYSINKKQASLRYKEKKKNEEDAKNGSLKKEKDIEAIRSGKYHNLFRTSLIVNIVLVITVIGMIVMMNMSDIPTIVNYENKIINKYEDWQKSLEERENRIKQYEDKYDINDDVY